MVWWPKEVEATVIITSNVMFIVRALSNRNTEFLLVRTQLGFQNRDSEIRWRKLDNEQVHNFVVFTKYSIWDSHNNGYEEWGLLSCNAMQFGDKLIFRRNISPPSSGSNSKQSLKQAEAGGKLSLPPAYSLTLKMKAICSLWNIRFSLSYTVLQPRQLYSSTLTGDYCSLRCEPT
jgi:hypothetical protein